MMNVIKERNQYTLQQLLDVK